MPQGSPWGLMLSIGGGLHMGIAGHVFVDEGGSLRCSCGRRWVDIMPVTRADVGKPDIAHYGSLTLNEAIECEEECERFSRLVRGR